MKHKRITTIILTASLMLSACSTSTAPEATVTTTEVTAETTLEETTTVTTTEETTTTETTLSLTSYEGEWHRTNIHSGLEGTITISKMDDKGFYFSGDFQRFGNTGTITDFRADFISENKAEYRNGTEGDSESAVAVIFTLDNGEVTVDVDGDFNGLGLGMGVTIDGTYTKDEPVYTNANIVAETFSEEELKALKELLGDKYEEPFLNDTEAGSLTVSQTTLADKSKGRLINVFVPGLADFMGYDLIITDDGKIYYKHVTGTFATNDSGYEDEALPEHSEG